MTTSSKLLAAAMMVIFTVARAHACACSGIRGESLWDQAEKEEKASAAIFEGALERLTVEWDILNRKPGDWIPADIVEPSAWRDRFPRTLATFRVTRVYKGKLGATVQLHTGMGGGDCAAAYYAGLEYLVYAYEPVSGELWVNLCSPGGWLGSNYVEPELRYLRKQRPLPGDLAVVKYGPLMYRPEEYTRRFNAATGTICGRVVPSAAFQGSESVWIFRAGDAPVGDRASIKSDGTFCSGRLPPGKYYLAFLPFHWVGSVEPVAYYPGVVDRANATLVEVSAGQDRSRLVFSIPQWKAYTIRGFISLDEKSGLRYDQVLVQLVSPDGLVWRGDIIEVRGSFPLPKVKYFRFENVPPGRYIAWASAPGRGWFTRVVDVNVTNHSKLIFLELKHSGVLR
jgi:hypothetical protein